MKSKRRNHKGAEAIDVDNTEATRYGEHHVEIRHKNNWYSNVHTLKMNKNFWAILLSTRKKHLDTLILCAAAMREGKDKYTIPTPTVIQILKQIQVD